MREASANGAVIVSAIGNDGPTHGTLRNPADQLDVLGVGAMTEDGAVAPFSSRGPTLHELPAGAGRFKPDILAPGRALRASALYGGCRVAGGTSAAAAVVAGAVALLAAIARRYARPCSPAALRHVIAASAAQLREASVFEQGPGALDLVRAAAALLQYTPQLGLLPPAIRLDDCPYMWPHCAQPLYPSAPPLALNVTVLNALALRGRLAGPPSFTRTSGPDLLEVGAAAPDTLWPWVGHLSLWVRARAATCAATATVEGFLTLTVRPASVDADVARARGCGRGVRLGVEALGPVLGAWAAVSPGHCCWRCERAPRCQRWVWHEGNASCTALSDAWHSRRAPGAVSGVPVRVHATELSVALPLRVRVVPRPPRARRLLWDQYHNIQYPAGYVPRDNLDTRRLLFDSHGDHPHTNFRAVWDHLRAKGFYLDILTADYTTFDATLYAALLLVDPEEEFFVEEVLAGEVGRRFARARGGGGRSSPLYPGASTNG